jgi:dimethylamine monooxygenase subunit A
VPASASRLLRRPLPFAEGGARHRIGVRPIEPSEWLETSGDDVADQVAEKARVFDAHRAAVLGVLPAAEEACSELRDLVREQLPAGWTVAVPAGCHPLEEAGRLVPEDFCVHLPDSGTGMLTLTAGCVCFPNRWSLLDKLGHAVTAIHEPVPRYDPQLARPVERLMARLPEGRILERHNWAVVESGELHAPLRTAERAREWSGVDSDPWLRIERTTLRRLPRSGAVVFTIRTLTAPLDVVDADAQAAGLLADAIRDLPDEVAGYKLGPPGARSALLERLTRALPAS